MTGRYSTGFFDKVLPIFGDDTRDNFRAGLQALGIPAKMADRGWHEQHIVWEPFTRSLGFIDITEGPICWVNVLRRQYSIPLGQLVTTYYAEYGVHVPRLKSTSTMLTRIEQSFQIESVRLKASPFSSRVEDLRWEGEDLGLGIIERLNGDFQLKVVIMRNRDVQITARSDYMTHKTYWVIRTEVDAPPSPELWNCHQAIARHLRSAFGKPLVASKETVPGLIEALLHDSSYVREEAAKALRKLGPNAKAAVPALIEVLKNDDEYAAVCCSAAEALGEIGDEAAVPILGDTLNDKDVDDDVRKKAHEALQKIERKK